MPNVIHLLKQDHRTVEQLFEDFESSRAQAAVKRICDELTVHTQVEEKIVYPLLQKLDADMEKEAEQEHQAVKQLVTEIRAAQEGGERQIQLMTKLKEAVEHHVGEEEASAFPKMEDQSGEQLEELAVQVTEFRQQLLSGSVADDAASAGDVVDLTKGELYKMAQEADIPGRSDMTKDELAQALKQ